MFKNPTLFGTKFITALSAPKPRVYLFRKIVDSPPYKRGFKIELGTKVIIILLK
jgi:hypothetical protein